MARGLAVARTLEDAIAAMAAIVISPAAPPKLRSRFSDVVMDIRSLNVRTWRDHVHVDTHGGQAVMIPTLTNVELRISAFYTNNNIPVIVGEVFDFDYVIDASRRVVGAIVVTSLSLTAEVGSVMMLEIIAQGVGPFSIESLTLDAQRRGIDLSGGQ